MPECIAEFIWLPLAQDAPKSLLPGPVMLMAIVALFYFMMIRPEHQKQKQRRELLAAVKKNDRVVTVGGVHGVVTNVQAENNEVTIKVDEATNTKLRVALSAIDKIVTDESKEEKSGTKS